VPENVPAEKSRVAVEMRGNENVYIKVLSMVAVD
jgi:hypothetical protein